MYPYEQDIHVAVLQSGGYISAQIYLTLTAVLIVLSDVRGKIYGISSFIRPPNKHLLSEFCM